MIQLIQNVIKNSIRVEVKEKNRYEQYPVIVTDVAEGSITNGWSLTYYPKLTHDRQRLYDIKQAFGSLGITMFSNLYNAVMSVDQRFLAGEGVQELRGRKHAAYEFGDGTGRITSRFACMQKEHSNTITVSILDSNSPFYMLSINFTVMNSKQEPGKRHMVGSDKQWDAAIDVFNERNAQFAPDSARFIQVFQEGENTFPYVRAAMQSGMNGVSQVDPNASFVWRRDISNEFQALALAYEKVILRTAMEVAYDSIRHTLQATRVQEPTLASGNVGPFGMAAGAVASGWQPR
ncbi:hypothetical protein GZH47_33115 (plasmid) [Paenibacillus rhizovicinus]|uniref:Uncharacterized protein n=1 Tax=Paenibacillus rhizovicinus TaxID=2704463 RepID=A0A6C0PBJ7_9BACL|nr:hypothetical protein [Paenibacillus rhizovicinus]QHW35735.1 hypothetical protein GZH47_33115 [Paenibacillus rhizovicinus]